mgnify:CR=1 FL=1
MNNSSDFADYIFKSKKHLDYPEIIEFYTGIDRNKADALNVLLDDILGVLVIMFSSDSTYQISLTLIDLQYGSQQKKTY